MSTRHEAKIQAAIEQAKRLPESGSFSEFRGELIQSLQGASRLAAAPVAEHIEIASKALVQIQSLYQVKSFASILGQDELPKGIGRLLRRFARKLQSAIDSLQISKGIIA